MYTYFKPYKNYFWEWDTDDSDTKGGINYIVAIPNGQSIAYFDTISEDLEDLAPQGIPPFGALLLVLIAASATIQQSAFNLSLIHI